MILADKIITLRRQNGWSQEELAERLNVTRQSVSKWEGAQSVPELEKIVQLSRIFGVSTDYLLKEEQTEERCMPAAAEQPAPDRQDAVPETDRKVTMAEAMAFLDERAAAAKRLALAVFLCILSPACLLVLAAGADTQVMPISENLAAGVGLIVLFLMIAAAVAVFISSGMKGKAFEFLETEAIETEYGVSDMVREKREQYKNHYTRGLILGTSFCILSVIPLFLVLFLAESDFWSVVAVAVLLLLVGIGVQFFVRTGTTWSAMQKLLEEGDFSKQAKRERKEGSAFSTVYWLAVTAGFLAYSFITEDWERSWIVWPVAGVLFAAVRIIIGAFAKGREQN